MPDANEKGGAKPRLGSSILFQAFQRFARFFWR
jgi:hypothetical protein